MTVKPPRRADSEFRQLLRSLQFALALTIIVPLLAVCYLILRYVVPSSITEHGIIAILLTVMVLMLIGTRTIFWLIRRMALGPTRDGKIEAAPEAAALSVDMRIEGRSIRHKMAEATALVGIIPLLSLGYIMVRYVLPIETDENMLWLTSFVIILLLLGVRQTHKLTNRMITVAEGVKLLSKEDGKLFQDLGSDEIGMMSDDLRKIAITLSRRTEALEKTKAFLSNLIERLPHPLLVVGPSGEITLANPAAASLLEYDREKIIGKNVSSLFSSGTDATAVLGNSAVEALETVWQTRGEEKVPISLCAAPLSSEKSADGGLVLVGTDLTQSKKLEEELRHAVKMEAVGRLAGGIAHDFNNILTIIRGHLYFLKKNLDLREPKKNVLDSFYSTVDRASSLVYQLLAFSRKQILTPRVINLNRVIERMGGILERLLGEDVDVVTELAPDLGNTKADRGQMEQIIVNLAVNARDAMPGGGRLTITTSNLVIDRTRGAGRTGLGDGRYVLISVADTGCGMSEEVRSNIFEPFFTTKKVGKGSGLGLSTVYGIVTQHGGQVLVDSRVGGGSTFTVIMPRVSQTAEPEKPVPPEARLPGGTETMLFVEDDAEILDLAAEALRLHGYTVLTARNGREALKVARRHSGAIDILVTDVVMPLMGGKELADTIKASRSGTRVIYVSGYANASIITRDILEGGHTFIQKPYALEKLLTEIRKALDEGGKSPGKAAS